MTWFASWSGCWSGSRFGERQSRAAGVFHCVTCRPSAGRIAAPGLGDRLRPVETLASGVAHRLTIVGCLAFAPDSPWQPAFGVGHARAASVSVVPECRPLSVEYPAAQVVFESPAVAVGQHEESLAEVRRPDLGRAEQTPLRIEPERGKVAEDVGEPKANVARDVLEEGEGGSALVDDPSHFGPEVALVGFSSPLAGEAEGLARVARSDEIHDSTPRAAIEGSQIVGDRSAIQLRRLHPRHEDGRGEGFPLDVANGAAS